MEQAEATDSEGNDDEADKDAKRKNDPEASSDYSTKLIGTTDLMGDVQDRLKVASRLLRASDFRPNRSLNRHCAMIEEEKQEHLREEAELLHKYEQYELPSEKYLN